MSDSSKNIDRRREPRHQVEEYPLRVNRHDARLIDWSVMGMKVQIRVGIEDYNVGDAVTIAIPSDQTGAVAILDGLVRRTDSATRTLGIELDADSASVAPLIAELTS